MADNVHEHDKQVLHKMGYAQELARRMSGFSNFAISFSIICILAGGISAFPAAFNAAGPGGAVLIWLIGGALAIAGNAGLCLAVVLALQTALRRLNVAAGLEVVTRADAEAAGPLASRRQIRCRVRGYLRLLLRPQPGQVGSRWLAGSLSSSAVHGIRV